MELPGESSHKHTWVRDLPQGEATKDTFARYVDEGDEAEIEYYEDAADPDTAWIERQRRRYRGMFRRRMRRRASGSQ